MPYRQVLSASAGIQFNKFGQEGIDMRINRGISVVAALFSAIGLTACGGGPKVMTEKMPESGFLPNYKVMQVVDNTPKDIHAWRYLKPGIQSSSYTAVMFDPIYLNQAEYTKEITPEVIAQTRKILEEAMRQAIQRRSDIKVVDDEWGGIHKYKIFLGTKPVDYNKFDKDDYMTRYKDRGNSEDFLELMDNNFESFIQDVISSEATIAILDKGQYLSDYLTTPKV